MKENTPQKCICLLQRDDTAGDFYFHHYIFKMLYNEQKHYSQLKDMLL